MRIGTITTHTADNYGAVLQAYALSTYLDRGSQCEIVNYCPSYARERYGLRRKIRSPKSLLYALYDRAHAQERKRRKDRFEAFRASHMKLSRECATREELKALAGDYDAVVTGSDQVWNPELHGFDENYFLTFCPEHVRKYGYAPSFGLSSLREKQKRIVKLRCEGFSDMAFRERSGARIAGELFGAEFPLVLDPVFLLGCQDWEALLPDVAPAKPYYLCYYLSDPRASVRHVCAMGRRDGVDVISIGYSIKDPLNSARKVYDLGPLEFLSYIRHAQCVFTDSFHATAFSIIFKRPFCTRVDGKNAKRADRVLTLTDSLGLSDRTYAESDIAALTAAPVDYAALEEPLGGMIRASQEYADSITAASAPVREVKRDVLRGVKAFGGYILDAQVLGRSSSGGFAAAMARQVLREGGVVYGVAYTADFRGAEYRRIDRPEELDALLGSKYIRSSGVTRELVQSVQSDLLQRPRVLFTGLPCEIAALLGGLKAQGGADLDRLVTVDLICHGPTCPEVQAAYVDQLERSFGGKVRQFSVRYKRPGWTPAYVHAVFDNGREYTREFIYTDLGEAFAKMPQRSCLSCRFKGSAHAADITIGDYWGVPKDAPAWNPLGVSVALTHTRKGEDFLLGLDGVALYPADAGYVIEHNLNYAFPVEKPPQYEAFCADFQAHGLHSACRKHRSRRKKLLMLLPQWLLDRLKKVRRA